MAGSCRMILSLLTYVGAYVYMLVAVSAGGSKARPDSRSSVSKGLIDEDV